jgi:hypothetical protein
MAYTKYSLTPADNNAAPPNGAPEGMLPSAVNDTMRDMMSQIRDVGDGIRGGTYTMTAPVITGGSINGTTVGAGTASTGAFTTLGATGVATFSAGTVSAPAITTTGDTNTGIFFPAADTIAFTEGGVESMRIDASGNLGLGTVSPAAKFNVTGHSSNLIASFNKGATTQGYVRLSNSAQAYDTYVDINNNGSNVWALFDGTGAQYIDSYNPGASGYRAFYTVGSERMRIDSAGNVGIGTSSPSGRLNVAGSAATNTTGINLSGTTTGYNRLLFSNTAGGGQIGVESSVGGSMASGTTAYATVVGDFGNNPLQFITNNTVRATITSDGSVFIGNTTASYTVKGYYLSSGGEFLITNTQASGTSPLEINRQASDGDLIRFYQANTLEGTVSVSGTTVSYNGGHLARWSQLPDGSKDDTILKGTVLSNLDDMCVWEKDGVVADNEQLNKMKISDVEGDTNVAGVFVNWTRDENFNSDDMNIAMTGDMIIRIADGVVVQKGDLLMSAGDGTAKPQGDDIVRSKTIAKVTSNYITCTYADGSYCVPCVLMAC